MFSMVLGSSGNRRTTFLSPVRIFVAVLLALLACLFLLYITGMLAIIVAALCAFTTASSSSLPEYRLKMDVIPTHYILEMITDLDNFTFQGKVWIKLDCKEATKTIYLHARNLTLHDKNVTFKHVESEKDFKELPISSITTDTKNEFMVIKLDEEVSPGKNYILYIPFEGVLSEGLAGYYRSSYHDRTSNTTKWLSVTQFESTDARKAFPCFDEPAMKAKFTIKLAHKENLKSASNMPLARTVPFEGRPGWVWSEFQDTVPMSTYLVAFMVSDYEFKESDPQPNNVVFRVWARRDAINQVEFAKKVGPKFLSYYEKYFDVAYPLPKQDMVAIPDFNAGAMENWGLITYREVVLLYDEKETSQANQHSIASVIAHELAHQWFGNLVTMKWWTDLWLNEGFATYVAGLGVHNEFPEWNSLDAVAVDNLLLVFFLDALKSSHPVSVQIGHPSQITQIFDHISYKKGAFLLRMMNLFLGEEVFRRGVNEYLKKHRYGNAEQDDLWDSLTEQAMKSEALPPFMTVKEIMDSWTVQTGYPVLNITRDYSSGNATITQKRFLAVKPKEGEENKECWWVPITYFVPSRPQDQDTRPKHWLSCDKNQLSINTGADQNQYVIFNNKFAGLYRVNYDQQNWQLIASALNSSARTQINVLNRVQLLTDCMDLAWRGDLPYPLALSILGYLKHETEYLPWKAGFTALHHIDRMLRRTPKYGNFRRFVQNLITPIYEKMGQMTEVPKTYEGVKLKHLVFSWACRFEVGDCVKQSIELFSQWKNDVNGNNPIPKDLRGVVYCQGVRNGGEEAWEFLWNKRKQSNVGTEKNIILTSLSCAQKVWLLNRYLDWSLDDSSEIRRQDSSSVFTSVANQDVGYYLAYKFFFRNIEQIYTYYGPKAVKLGRYIDVFSDQIIYEEDFKELQALIEKHKSLLEESTLSVSQSLETIIANIAWMKDNYQSITEALTNAY